MDTKRLYVDFHVLQTVPPSCVNRDDTGSPKTAVYGGAVRARVSSQAWKHAMRVMFTGEMSDAVETGYRTKKGTDLVAKQIKALAPDADAFKLTQEIFKMLKIKADEDGTKALFFMSDAQAKALAKLFCLPVGMERMNASPNARTVCAACSAPSVRTSSRTLTVA